MSVTLPVALNPDDKLATLDLADIGWRIKRLRQDRGWTQFDLHIATGAARVTIAKWETGKWAPSVEAFCRLADLFDCRLDWLVRGRS